MLLPALFIDNVTGMGRGVFTNETIPPDTIIESSPVIVMTKEERIHLDETLLHDYIFEWGKAKDQCCMALGLIPMYNHSYVSNCEYFMDFEEEMIFIKTVREINAGEELTINYNGDWDDKTEVWFSAK